MQINKNDLLNGIYKIQNRHGDHGVGNDASSPVNHRNQDAGTSDESLSVDMMRSRVLNLQHEVKDIQSDITGYQGHRAFLENLPDKADWRAQLKKFTGQPMPDLDKVPTLDNYLSHLEHEIGKLNKDLFTSEVKLENIISAGLGENLLNDPSAAIMRDMDQARTIFSRIRQDAVGKLIN